MSKKYSEEFKSSIISKLLPPNNVSVPDLVRETGIPRDTLYAWRNKYRNVQDGFASGQGGQVAKISNEEKLSIVIETASLNEVELGEYCRRKGLYPEQIAGWKNIFIQGTNQGPSKAEREELKQLTKAKKELQSELRRKQKALAEAEALLVLQKKATALWGDHEDEK